MSHIQSVTDSEFETNVLNADRPVLVDFWAEWCGPCRQVAPILEQIAAEHSERLTILKMNVDENPQTPSTYRVTGIPAMGVFSDGTLQKMIVGAKPKDALLNDLGGVLEA